MKASPFRYCRPDSMGEALELLERYGDDARVLAGGQSLIPAMSMRLSAPLVLVDLSRVLELRGIAEASGSLRIGAMARHQEVENSPLVAIYAPLLSSAMRLVAHPPIRAMGTYGGSVALADPAAEAPAATLAHEATLVIRSSQGERRIKADDFFLGLYETALEPATILVAAEFPRPPPDHRFVFRELARRSGDFATVGIALRAAVRSQHVGEARIVLFGVSDRPITAPLAARALSGRDLGSQSIDAALQALGSDVVPLRDLHHTEATKMHLLRVLLRRVLKDLEEGAQNA